MWTMTVTRPRTTTTRSRWTCPCTRAWRHKKHWEIADKASIDKYRETLGIVINNYGTQSTQFRNMSRNLSIALRNAGYSRWDLKLSEILVHELVKRYGATGKETVEELKKMRQKFLKTNRAKHARNIQEILDQIEDLKTEINELNLQL